MTIYVHDERLEELMDKADVNHAQRLTFRTDPERAITLLNKALRKRKVRNPAAYALSCFRRETDPTTDPDRVRRFVHNMGAEVAHDRSAFDDEALKHLNLRPCPYLEELRHQALHVAHDRGACFGPSSCPVCRGESVIE